MQRFRFGAALAAASLLAACGGPQVPGAQNYATVFGRVYDQATNAPVAGAVVIILVSYRVTSASDGSYSQGGIPSGQVDVQVQAPSGYLTPQVPPFSVNNGDKYRLDIPLTHQ